LGGGVIFVINLERKECRIGLFEGFCEEADKSFVLIKADNLLL
jgi:hypothetical protein